MFDHTCFTPNQPVWANLGHSFGWWPVYIHGPEDPRDGAKKRRAEKIDRRRKEGDEGQEQEVWQEQQQVREGAADGGDRNFIV